MPFLELLKADLHNTKQLQSLMQLERGYIEQRDLEALNNLLVEKAELLSSIEENELKRRKSLIPGEFDPSPEGYRAYIATLEPDLAKQCHEYFELLQTELLKCKELNTVNGIVVNRSQRRNRQTLDILKGKPAQNELYTKSGVASNSSGSNPISAA